MVGQLDEVGRSLYQAQLSQRGVCHRSDFGGIRIDDLQVFCKNLRGTCSLGAGGVVIDVATLKLSGEGRWCGVGMEGQMEIVVARVGQSDGLQQSVIRVISRKGNAAGNEIRLHGVSHQIHVIFFAPQSVDIWIIFLHGGA